MSEKKWCELCGSDRSVFEVVVSIDPNEDVCIKEKAHVCLYCYASYPNNLALMVDVMEKRIQEHEDGDIDDREALQF